MTPNNEKKKLTWKSLLPILLVFVLMGGYGYYDLVLKPKITGSTLIDNPTAQAINVTIDDKSYTVPANSYEKISITKGIHHITCKEHNIHNQEFNIEDIEYGVINPTKSKYVIYNIVYTEKDLSDQFKPYQIEGREIYSLLGEPEVTSTLFIPDLTMGKGNIDDKEPAFKDYNRISQDYAFQSKIFRLKDFFEFYDKENNK
ncbi:hypothetical protein [Pedobacter punctiformis]|uniref:PEGA domain-containing protein n=1 Tax=Pedobacter punctiformis TaxID=3004097 RepID=A0ABT4LBE2_9SPHI|nr:hypothetical protein [Pedobacter sp. HCMS5-2]MCZ4244124.1 hypothetical protein [Pedobacter sp. HCMS5-2]